MEVYQSFTDLKENDNSAGKQLMHSILIEFGVSMLGELHCVLIRYIMKVVLVYICLTIFLSKMV